MLELLLTAALVLGQTEEVTAPLDTLPATEDPDAAGPDDPAPQPASPNDYTFVTPRLVDVAGGATKASVLTQFPTPNYGYFPLVFHVDNTLGPKQSVKVSFTSTGSGGGNTFSRSVEVRAGERRAVVLPVPSHVRYGSARARGPGLTEPHDQQVYFNPVTFKQRAILNLGTPESFEAAVKEKPTYAGSNEVQVVTLSVSEAPDVVTPYVGWDTVVVSGATLDGLSEAQRRALEAYAALGGHLVLMQSARGAGAAFPLLQDDAPAYGLGRLTFCQGCGLATVLGHVARVPVRAIEPKGRRNRYDSDGTPELKLPVAVAPIGRFMLIITAFTLAIGPGSLWVARRKGPAALLVTIPGTAAVTCLAIVGYSLLRDGFTVHATVHGVTLLDNRARRAVTASVGAFYANLAPGGARFADDTVVVAPAPTREYNVPDQTASISFDDGARFGADFIPSRSYMEWSFLSVSPTRARLVVKVDGKQVTVQNALGGEIDFAVIRLKDGLYSVSALKDGEQKAAHRQDGTSTPTLSELGGRMSEQAHAVLHAPLRDGEFMARARGPLFTPLGGLQLQHNESSHLVRGGYDR